MNAAGLLGIFLVFDQGGDIWPKSLVRRYLSSELRFNKKKGGGIEDASPHHGYLMD